MEVGSVRGGFEGCLCLGAVLDVCVCVCVFVCDVSVMANTCDALKNILRADSWRIVDEKNT